MLNNPPADGGTRFPSQHFSLAEHWLVRFKLLIVFISYPEVKKKKKI